LEGGLLDGGLVGTAGGFVGLEEDVMCNNKSKLNNSIIECELSSPEDLAA
jgi:hypothetical protein